MRVLDASGQEGSIPAQRRLERRPRAYFHASARTRADVNALGVVRVDMPNGTCGRHARHAVEEAVQFLDHRFISLGRARIADVRDLATWILKWTNPVGAVLYIDASKMPPAGAPTGLRLPKPIRSPPLVYMTAWAGRDGTVDFRNDVDGHDEPPARPHMVDLPPRAVTVARASGFILQSADPAPREFKEVSYLDSQ